MGGRREERGDLERFIRLQRRSNLACLVIVIGKFIGNFSGAGGFGAVQH